MPAPQTQALYAESKQRLSERLQSSVTNVGSLARLVVRGSKSSETMSQAIRASSSLENVIDVTENNLKRSENLTNQMKMSLMKMRIIEVDNTCQKMDTCLNKYIQSQPPSQP